MALTITGAAFPQHPDVVVPADTVPWGHGGPGGRAPSAQPAGAKIGVLEGDPGQESAITLRLQCPASATLPPHWHSMTERVTVLSGALHVVMGDTLDRQRSQTLRPGGFVSPPAKMPHYAWTAIPTVVQIHLEEPFDIFLPEPGRRSPALEGNRRTPVATTAQEVEPCNAHP